ncbi:uncharacterized protein BDZ99DRAFT_532175 [Mytilinidion resinicola]|uniref:Uncharacterized protein n=1 Tax=Mytilinidion resinicola TaxID=574789 RepID=A0A6A6YM61_9PEZI|nr:uncharacterized protein BDZ99DRAFT_532175 [Mytilinidion resinicola]KAF2809639.1 hypothetical protein BDZ99DRAFT_532175 [Mytilinidion resinicola]
MEPGTGRIPRRAPPSCFTKTPLQVPVSAGMTAESLTPLRGPPLQPSTAGATGDGRRATGDERHTTRASSAASWFLSGLLAASQIACAQDRLWRRRYRKSSEAPGTPFARSNQQPVPLFVARNHNPTADPASREPLRLRAERPAPKRNTTLLHHAPPPPRRDGDAFKAPPARGSTFEHFPPSPASGTRPRRLIWNTCAPGLLPAFGATGFGNIGRRTLTIS